MSTSSTPSGSPALIQPLHNPSQAAHVVVPQAPLGNVVNQAPGMGAKALLAKKMAKNQSATLPRTAADCVLTSLNKFSNPTYISPTDNLMTPCTQKLNAARKKHFNKCVACPLSSILLSSLPTWRPGERNQYSYLLRTNPLAKIK